MGPGLRRYRMHISLPASSAPIHLAPRQRGEGGAQRVSVGRVRGARSLGTALSWTKGQLVQVPAVWLRGAVKKQGNKDAPHPPIASQRAPPSPRFAGERCMGGASPRDGGPKMRESDSGL